MDHLFYVNSRLWLHVFSKMMVLTEKTLFLDQIDDWLLKKKLDRFFFFFFIFLFHEVTNRLMKGHFPNGRPFVFIE